MKMTLWMILGAFFLVAISPSIAASSANKNCRFDCPLAATKLPHPPTFTPKSGKATVLQRFVIGDWFYKVCYVYGTPESKTAPGWTLAGMSAARIRIPGAVHPQNAQRELQEGVRKANTSNDLPCTLPDADAETSHTSESSSTAR